MIMEFQRAAIEGKLLSKGVSLRVDRPNKTRQDRRGIDWTKHSRVRQSLLAPDHLVQ